MQQQFSQLVQMRQSVRGFLPDPVSNATIQQVLDDARYAPSNCNTQPWNAHIVSGESRDRLSVALLDAARQGQFSPDFSFSNKAYTGVYAERAEKQGEVYHNHAGVDRNDQQARMELALKNYEFFGAPHVALLFMPEVGDSVRVAGDIGMYGQTFLLSLVAHGLAGVPQTSVGMLAETVRKTLGVSPELKLLFSIAFGFPASDESEKSKMTREDIESAVVFHK